jgi:hypothetical protein
MGPGAASVKRPEFERAARMVQLLSDQALAGEHAKGPEAFMPEAWAALDAELQRRQRAALAVVDPLYRACQGCGTVGPTALVDFRKNIGALVVRFNHEVSGALCKKCVNRYFWSYTLTTFFLGWWGLISFFVTPFNILTNIAQYLDARRELRRVT